MRAGATRVSADPGCGFFLGKPFVFLVPHRTRQPSPPPRRFSSTTSPAASSTATSQTSMIFPWRRSSWSRGSPARYDHNHSRLFRSRRSFSDEKTLRGESVGPTATTSPTRDVYSPRIPPPLVCHPLNELPYTRTGRVDVELDPPRPPARETDGFVRACLSTPRAPPGPLGPPRERPRPPLLAHEGRPAAAPRDGAHRVRARKARVPMGPTRRRPDRVRDPAEKAEGVHPREQGRGPEGRPVGAAGGVFRTVPRPQQKETQKRGH